jgi:S-adenosyl-L-methionine hydrolase (adenosine-forming)
MIITLTTDFGLADGYVGATKGVIFSRAPRAQLVDISHRVPPQDVRHAAFVLAQAAEFFPPDTVHVAVVDPGVGGSRRGIVVARRRQFFVGPDNGIFSYFLDDQAVCHELKNPNLWLPEASATFHGRDLFAPAAAHLAQGLELADCGPRIEDPVRLPGWTVHKQQASFETSVVHVDHFGNCITALPAARLGELGQGPYLVTALDRRPVGLRRTYGDVAPGEPLALVGSTGLVEIAVRDGSAAEELSIGRGTQVQVTLS